MMSGFAGFVVVHDHWFVHLPIFLVNLIGQLTSNQFVVCVDTEFQQTDPPNLLSVFTCILKNILINS
jgi:hypothetical protein